MIKAIYDLDMTPRRTLPIIINVSQYDDLGRTLVFNLFSSSGKWTAPTSAAVTFEGGKPDGKFFAYNCAYSSGTVTVTIQQQMTAVAGKVRCKIKVKSGDKVVESAPIIMVVDAAAVPDGSDMSKSDINDAIANATQKIVDQVKDNIPSDYAQLSTDVSSLKQDLGYVKAELPNVGKVKSVNGKQGDVIITSEDIGYSAPEETINNTVKKWLNDHPEATTTVQDGAITLNKLSKDAVKDTIDMSYGQIGTPMVSFVTDDGQLTDYTIFYKKIFKPLGVPASTAVIGKAVDVNPNWLTTEQCKEMKSDGWTIASHTYNDLVTNESGVTKGDIETDFELSSKWLFERGFDYDIYVAPHGSWTPDTDECARKIFRCCILTGHMFNDGAYDTTGIGRTGIFDNYSILRRSGIGDSDNKGNAITKEGMIADIQYAVKNNLWLVFVMHSWKDVFSEEQNGVDDLIEVVTYCKTNNIPIVNLKDGLRLKGNTIDVAERINGKKWCRGWSKWLFLLSRVNAVLQSQIQKIKIIM